MASRGRGGGGRGRGRASLSFNVEQLGLGPGDLLPGPVLQPPPLFPPLEFRPAPLVQNEFYNSQLELKKNLMEYFTKSSAYIRQRTQRQETDQLTGSEESKKFNNNFLTDWSFVPPELKPSGNKRKRKNSIRGTAMKKSLGKNVTNITSWLDELEKKESTEDDQEKDPAENEKKKDEEDQDGEQNEDFEEDDMDEEMDDGTDYNQNYFDNGEGYLDEEDDNLDDGPIY